MAYAAPSSLSFGVWDGHLVSFPGSETGRWRITGCNGCTLAMRMPFRKGLSMHGDGRPWTVAGVNSTSSSARQFQFPSSRMKPLSVTAAINGISDPDLRFVLQLANDAELEELSSILYGRSLLSPLVKSLAAADGSEKHDENEYFTEKDQRNALLSRLESRFLFLAADAKATLSGRRPRYRDVLLQVRKKLSVPCATDLHTEALESEIFLHLIEQSSRADRVHCGLDGNIGLFTSYLCIPKKHVKKDISLFGGLHDKSGNGDPDIPAWRTVWPTLMKVRGKEMFRAILKGGGVVTVSSLQRLVFKRLTSKLFVETARYQLAKEAVLKTGQAAAALEARVAVLAAKQGLAGAAKRYLTLRGAMAVLGPLLWGSLLAEVVFSSVGTDYSRVVRAICAFAQIRLVRSYSVDGEMEYLF